MSLHTIWFRCSLAEYQIQGTALAQWNTTNLLRFFLAIFKDILPCLTCFLKVFSAVSLHLWFLFFFFLYVYTLFNTCSAWQAQMSTSKDLNPVVFYLLHNLPPPNHQYLIPSKTTSIKLGSTALDAKGLPENGSFELYLAGVGNLNLSKFTHFFLSCRMDMFLIHGWVQGENYVAFASDWVTNQRLLWPWWKSLEDLQRSSKILQDLQRSSNDPWRQGSFKDPHRS